jgi:hypothetical protein
LHNLLKYLIASAVCLLAVLIIGVISLFIFPNEFDAINNFMFNTFGYRIAHKSINRNEFDKYFNVNFSDSIHFLVFKSYLPGGDDDSIIISDSWVKAWLRRDGKIDIKDSIIIKSDMCNKLQNIFTHIHEGRYECVGLLDGIGYFVVTKNKIVGCHNCFANTNNNDIKQLKQFISLIYDTLEATGKYKPGLAGSMNSGNWFF